MAIESKNLLVWVKAMSRGNALPLDASEIHESLAAAQTYAGSAIAYEGQTIKAKLSAEVQASLDKADAAAGDATAKADEALADAKEYADGLNTAMDTRVQAVEGTSHSHANKAELDKIATGDKAKWDAAEQNAKDYADGLNTAMDSRVAALEGVTYTEITAEEVNAMFG